jgi:hypothetical protein
MLLAVFVLSGLSGVGAVEFWEKTVALAVAPSGDGRLRLQIEPRHSPELVTSCKVWRKLPDEPAWTLRGTTAPPTLFEYLDGGIEPGVVYEYKASLAANSTTTPGAAINGALGYAAGGIALPAAHVRKRVILVVESILAQKIPKELALFEQDLRGDGWLVHRLEAPTHIAYPTGTLPDGVPADKRWTMESNPAHQLRERIRNEILAVGEDPGNPESFSHVILLGKVQIPYSGLMAPDGHSDHTGAWPADFLYGDLDSNLTDHTIHHEGSSNRIDNFIGDGKFDLTAAGDLELAVGRISFHNMPKYKWDLDEYQLLARYIRKNHAWRTAQVRSEPQGLVSSKWWEHNSTDTPTCAGITYPQLFGWARSVKVGQIETDTKAFVEALRARTWTWAVSASYAGNDANSWVSSNNYADGGLQATFFAHFGSRHGDWDQKDNLLRAAICQERWGLVSHWGARPNVTHHQMAAGWTIGETFRQSLNQQSAYGVVGSKTVHAALLGDPTLRIHVLAPPGGLRVLGEGSHVRVSWAASRDAVAGYHIYRSAGAGQPFERIDTQIVAGTEFLDTQPLASGANATYQVRSAALVQRRGGSYWNLSQGVFSNGVNGMPGIDLGGPFTYGGLNATLTPKYIYDDRAASTLTFSWTLVSGAAAATFSQPSQSATTVSVAAPGLYVFRCSVSDGEWTSEDTVQIEFTGDAAVPEPPTNLTAVALSPDEVRIAWTHSSGAAASSFAVQSKINGGKFQSLPTQPPGSTSLTVGGLDPGVSYVFRVQAVNASGPSPWSEEAGVTTPMDDAGPLNVAPGGSVSGFSSEQPGFEALKAIDGMDSSDGNAWVASGYPQWIELDLGSDRIIAATEVVPVGSRAYRFLIEAKATGGIYSPLVDRTANLDPGPHLDTFAPRAARHVRLTVEGAHNHAGTEVGIREFKVYTSAPPLSPPETYGGWAARQAWSNTPPEKRAPGSDFDGDGLLNSLERAFGTDPTSGAHPHYPFTAWTRGTDGTLTVTMTFPALMEAAAYTMQGSAFLESWSNVDASPAYSPQTGLTTISYSFDPLASPLRFFRLKVEE